MARILVAGATGFIGSRLVEKLRSESRHEIFALTKTKRDPVNGIRWIIQDLSKSFDSSLFPKSLDAIIHLAQSKHYKQFPQHADDIFGINIHGTFQLLEYGRKCGITHFIFASTGGVYGFSFEKFIETDPVGPLNFYLTSKYSAELMISNYKDFFNTIVFRFFFVYGPGQHHRLIPDLLEKAKESKPITIEGNPGIRINPIYVDDLVRVFEPALQLQGPDLINVAGEEIVTMTELVNLLARVPGEKAVINYTDHQSQGDLVGDNSRMKKLLKIVPQITLFDGLQRMA